MGRITSCDRWSNPTPTSTPPPRSSSPPAASAPNLRAPTSVCRPPRSRPARSVEFDQAILRWGKLTNPGRSGLCLISDDGASSMDSIIFADIGVRHIATPPEKRPVPPSTSETTEVSVPSATPSPQVPARDPACNRSSPMFMEARTLAESPSMPVGSPGHMGLRWDLGELTALKQKFNTLDAEGRGFLTRAQFYDLFSSIVEAPGVDTADNSPLFNFAYSLFHSSGEKLDLKEFVAGMTVLSKGSEEERMRYLFHMYDADNSGALNAEEIKRVFRIMRSYAQSQHFKASDSMEGQTLATLRLNTTENLDQLSLRTLKEMDVDGDGAIGFEDFEKWCASDPIVKTWMDMLCFDTARGVARLRNEVEKTLLAKELDLLGFADNAFWRKSFLLNNNNSSHGGSSSLLPPPISPHDPTNGAGSTDLPILSPSPSKTPDTSMSVTENAIGSFEIDFTTLLFEKQIGSGSFAVVWKCTWLDSPVAVKVFKSGPRLVLNADGTAGTATGRLDVPEVPYSEDGESFEPEFDSIVGPSAGTEEGEGMSEMATNRARFLQEVSLLKSIRHPNLLLYMGACVDPHYPLCIVSELIDGGSLYDLLHGPDRVTLSLRQKLMLTQDIARGMLYLHGRDPLVLHRDLKSANILVERQTEDYFKGTIIDFGLSKLNSTQASLVPGRGRGLTGSLVTMAPEVMHEQQYQPRSDVYSFGIICWEIFVGRVPFGRFSQMAQLMMKVAVKGERPEIRGGDGVPSGIEALIRACWDQDINKRPDFLVIVKKLNGIKHGLNL